MHPPLTITGATHLFTAPTFKKKTGQDRHIYTYQNNDIENIYNVEAINNQEKVIKHYIYQYL